MKKISRYLIIVVVIGGALVSFWSYQKYFKKESPELLLFSVERGSIQEVVKVRGEIVPQKDFDLEFPFSGIVENIFTREGQRVEGGDPLIKLETTSFELELRQSKAQLAQAQAFLATQKSKLAELRRGTREEEIKIQELRISNAQTSVEDAQQDLIDKLQDAYTKSDDAVRNKVDQFFINPRGSDPQLNFLVTNQQLASDVAWQRIAVENTLVSWKLSLNQLTTTSDLDANKDTAKKNLDQIKSFLDQVALAVNGATPNSNLSQTTIDTWKSNTVTARANVNVAITNLTTVVEKLKNAASNLALAKQELILKQAGTVAEQLAAQEAQVKQAEANIQNSQAQIAIVQEKIKKSTIYAPISSKIVKIWFEEKELFKPGQTAITLETSGHKIQADISELEIGKVREVNGNEVLIQLDAFPNLELKGKVISIEPREIIKDGDKYYRANISLEQHDAKIRSGMNANLLILIAFKDAVLKIPELAIFQKNGKKFVTILENGAQKEVAIETGISNGESIEVVKGLSENQVVVVVAD